MSGSNEAFIAVTLFGSVIELWRALEGSRGYQRERIYQMGWPGKVSIFMKIRVDLEEIKAFLHIEDRYKHTHNDRQKNIIVP